MAAPNQYTGRRHPGTETVLLQGTLQQKIDLLRQVLQEHEQRLPAQRYQQELDLDRQATPGMQSWSRVPHDQQLAVVYSRPLPNGRTVSARYEARTDCWMAMFWKGTLRVEITGLPSLGRAIDTALIEMGTSSWLGRPPDPEQLQEWATGPSLAARRWIANSRSCTPELLDQLAGDPNPEVRLDVAGSRRCPPGTLQRLLQDPDQRIKSAAADNPRCPKAARAMYQLTR
jgi:hypothetical protein